MSKTSRSVIAAVITTVMTTLLATTAGQPITAASINAMPAVVESAVGTAHLLGSSATRPAVLTSIAMSTRSTDLAALSSAPAVADRVADDPPDIDDPPDGSAAPYDAGLAGSAVGQLLSPSSSCTATMIPSTSGQIAVTAAHCVYVAAPRPQLADQPLPPGWIDELVFVPGRTGGQAPFGQWPVVRVWIDASYRDTAAPAADVAFIELARREGPTAQEVLGAQGVSFRDRPRAGLAATMLGYPTGAPFDGTLLRRCTTSAITTPYADLSGGAFDLVAMACVMTEGSSGGPWLTGFDTATGTGTLIAVTSFRSEDDPSLILATPMGLLAQALLRTADTTATDTEAGTRTENGSARRAASRTAENSRDIARSIVGTGRPSP